MRLALIPVRVRPLLLCLAVLALFAGAVWADEPVPVEPLPAEGAVPAPEPAMSAEDMDAWIQESPAAVWAVGLLKFGSGLVGLVLLVWMWVRWERVRAGVLPAPERVTATMPFSLSNTLMILGCAFVLLVLSSMIIQRAQLEGSSATAVGMLATQGLLLAAALLVVLRRRRLDAGPRRSPIRVTGWAFGTFFIASAIVIPTMLLSILILRWIEFPITVQKPVEDIVRGTGTSTAWVIMGAAAVLAPVAEESLFRGLLYPALRSSLKVRHAALFSAVGTSALFALMHPNPPSWLPLFALAMVLTWIFERTNSLAAVIGAHALWNVATLVPLLIRGLA